MKQNKMTLGAYVNRLKIESYKAQLDKVIKELIERKKK